uniref:Uncharacterized protein n=1 Tax=Arundo donax TaxID=35708 RepID=A0A0A8XZK6_ARUDO
MLGLNHIHDFFSVQLQSGFDGRNSCEHVHAHTQALCCFRMKEGEQDQRAGAPVTAACLSGRRPSQLALEKAQRQLLIPRLAHDGLLRR